MENQENIKHQSYKFATDDNTFLHKEQLRGLRLMLEYQKPEETLIENGIASTIVTFGSARVLSHEQIEKLKKTIDYNDKKQLTFLNQKEKQLKWYTMARDFAFIASKNGGAINGKDNNGLHHNVIATGGGPGLMEAANRGAFEAGAPSIGFTIELPFEEKPNKYSTPGLTFRFKYFGIRKMHLLLRCKALAVFPGGFGTLDELFDCLNLFSTKVEPCPVIFFDSAYWKSILNMDALFEHGMISESALSLFDYADSAQEGWDLMLKAGLSIKNAK